MHISKGKLRFNKRELWNGCDHLSSVIVSFLEQFKKLKKHGVAPHVVDQYSEEEYNAMTDKEHEQHWADLLDSMIYGFTKRVDYMTIEKYDFTYNDLMNPDEFDGPIYNEHPVFGRCRVHQTKIKEPYTQADIDAYWKRADEYNEEVNAKIDKGRELFIKYFDNLWD